MHFCLFVLLIATVTVANGNDDDFVNLVQDCVTSLTNGKNSEEAMRKVAKFSNWVQEEVPCFTRCIAAGKGWFNVNESKWNKQQLVDILGADMYNYCRYELNRPFKNSCTFAYNGLRCLKEAEVQLSVTYANLLHCVSEFHASTEQLQRYATFPNTEVVPCLFNCVAERLHLYTPTYDWNLDNWVKAFGPMKYNMNETGICQVNTSRRTSEGKCAWMYDEYICIERLHYNTDGSIPATTMMAKAETTTKFAEKMSNKRLGEND